MTKLSLATEIKDIVENLESYRQLEGLELSSRAMAHRTNLWQRLELYAKALSDRIVQEQTRQFLKLVSEDKTVRA